MSTTRRVFPESFKREAVDRVVTSGLSAGKVAADVARLADVCTSVLYRWRQLYMARPKPGFAPAVVVDAPSRRSTGAEPAMVVEFSGGARVSIAAGAPAALVTAALRALR